MLSRILSLKSVATVAAALAVILVLVLSAGAGDKNKNRNGGGGGNKQGQNCPPPLVKKGGNCVMPGQGKANKQQGGGKNQVGGPPDRNKQGGRPKGQKNQAGGPPDRNKPGGKHGGKNKDKAAGPRDDKKQVGKPPRNTLAGDRQGGKPDGKDKDQAGAPTDGKKQGGKDKDKGQAGGPPDHNKQGGKDHGGKNKDKDQAGGPGDDNRDGKKHGGKDGDRDRDNDKVADCKRPFVYRRGKGCVKPNREPELVKCQHPKVWRRGRGCVRPGRDQVFCGWPMIKRGNSCVCGPGFIPRHGDCYRPPIFVVPVGPEPYPEGPYPEGPYPEGPYPEGPYHDGPPPGPGPRPGPGPVDDGPPDYAPEPPQQAEPAPPPELEAEPQPVAALDPAITRCLADDLYDLLAKTYGKPRDLDRCPSACLPKPAFFSPGELDDIAEQNGIDWCENCVQVGGYIPLSSALRLERGAGVTICVNPDMCRLPSAIPVERRSEIRTVFKDLPVGVHNEGNIAVVVGNQDYQGDLPANPDGSADADAVMTLLIDQLGYKQENIIDLRDATLAELERVFGGRGEPGGELAKRIDKDSPGDVFIYVASHGLVKNGKEAYLLPVDADIEALDQTAYPMQGLYDNLGKLGARTIMLMLEANFARNLDELIDPPNLPELEVEVMPATPVPGLAVFKASDRDQKTILDPEYGIGLFTRYLIEGLAGRADAAPIGNDDKRIDTVELYVYTSDAVRTAARKSFGLEQKPLLSKIDNLLVGQLSSN